MDVFVRRIYLCFVRAEVPNGADTEMFESSELKPNDEAAKS